MAHSEDKRDLALRGVAAARRAANLNAKPGPREMRLPLFEPAADLTEPNAVSLAHRLLTEARELTGLTNVQLAEQTALPMHVLDDVDAHRFAVTVEELAAALQTVGLTITLTKTTSPPAPPRPEHRPATEPEPLPSVRLPYRDD
jgi:hypothetical protein